MKKIIKYGMMLSLFYVTSSVYALTEMVDGDLSDVTGQALLNLEKTSDSAQGINFFKLGLSAEMELNTNINKLQLGCGGVNNSVRANSCDIDIDNISLSGIPVGNEERASTSAKITNPFIQLAIKNSTSAATRQVVGFRLSAEKISGLLTLGTANAVDANGNGIPNGINSFSGYMKTKQASGVAITEQRTMTGANGTLQGAVFSTVWSGVKEYSDCEWYHACTKLNYTSDTYSLTLNPTTAPFTINSTVVSGTRMKNVTLKGSGTVDQLNFSGPLTAKVLGLLNLEKQVDGYIEGLKTDITVNQDLGLIHALYLNNPASLSLQMQNILWPGASVAANKGWWLAMEDEVELGDLSPIAKVAITNAVLSQTITGINTDLTNRPRKCGDLLACVGGDSLTVGRISNTTTLDFPLTNLTLKGQDFKPNCFGGHKFC